MAGDPEWVQKGSRRRIDEAVNSTPDLAEAQNVTDSASKDASVAQFSRVPGEPDACQQKGLGTREDTSRGQGASAIAALAAELQTLDLHYTGSVSTAGVVLRAEDMARAFTSSEARGQRVAPAPSTGEGSHDLAQASSPVEDEQSPADGADCDFFDALVNAWSVQVPLVGGYYIAITCNGTGDGRVELGHAWGQPRRVLLDLPITREHLRFLVESIAQHKGKL